MKCHFFVAAGTGGKLAGVQAHDAAAPASFFCALRRMGRISINFVLMFSAGMALAQTPPSNLVTQTGSIAGYDGLRTWLILDATSPGVPVTWQVQVGTRLFNVDLTPSGSLPVGGFWTDLPPHRDYLTYGYIGPFVLSDDGQPVTLIATNAYGTTKASWFTARVTGLKPSVPVQPANTSAPLGSDAVFSAVFYGSPTIQYQWQRNGVDIAGATGSSYVARNVAMTDSGAAYQVVGTNGYGTITSTKAILTVYVVPVTFARQPEDVSVSEGSSVTFSTVVTGSAPIAYQWKKDGGDVAGATSASLTITGVRIADAGNYVVVVTNPAGVVASRVAALTVTALPISVTAQPQPATAIVGGNAVFQVTATGSGALGYQWLKDGNAIAGATSSTLNFANVQVSDAGNYSVKVSNGAGSITSSAAALTVIGPATILDSPHDATVALGQPVRFEVSVSGAAPFTFEWRHNGVPIAGATSAVLTLSSATAADAGDYDVTITNPAGAVKSQRATLNVTVPGRLVNLSILTSLAPGESPLTLGVVLAGSGPKPVLIRAAGPALAQFGVPNGLAHLKLELFSGNTKTNENTAWGGDPAIASAGAQVGAFSFGNAASQDAALYLPGMPAGNNSVRISSLEGGGAVLAEIYDASPAASLTAATPRLVNMSVLKNVGSGVTAGFVVGGSTPLKVLIRAVGPTLASFGVDGTVPSPQLELLNSDHARVAWNAAWPASMADTFASVGAFPLRTGSNDAAVVATLTPGSYSVQLSSADGSAGAVLLEIYEVAPP